MERVTGSMEVLSSMQITDLTAGMYAASKELLKNKEILAVILQEVIEEYRGYPTKEIMDFIEQDSITTSEVSAGRTNTKNIGSCSPKQEDYDLLTLVLIRLGDIEYNREKDSEGYDLLRFLNAIMYPHRENFMETIADYIDFSENEELRLEVSNMSGLGQSILEDGIEQGIEQGIEKINVLNQKLILDGRNDDLIRSCKDKEFQKKLMEEYGL